MCGYLWPISGNPHQIRDPLVSMNWVKIFFEHADKLTGYVILVGLVVSGCIFVIYPLIRDGQYVPRILTLLILIGLEHKISFVLTPEEKAKVRKYLDSN